MGPVAVTGGCGFIGAALVRKLVEDGHRVLNIDLLTYAGDEQRLAALPDDTVTTERIDIATDDMASLFQHHRPRAVFHLAAETHVTRSETDPDRFFRSNVTGTQRVLEAAAAAGVPRVLHVSTDEVYGPCPGDPFKEEDKGAGEGLATSAYARSKALADDVARGFTGDVEVVVVRPTNTYGPWQHPEKAIPRWTTRALTDKDIPVWGAGDQKRDWMFVDDACAGILLAGESGTPGEVYNLGPGDQELTNLDVAHAVARAAGRDEGSVYLTAYDRPDHDNRYAVDSSKLRALGWSPGTRLDEGIAATVAWYRANALWWEPLLAEAESIYEDDDRAAMP